MRNFVGVLVLLLLLALTIGGSAPAAAQSAEHEYFDQTGHNVQGEFLKFYRQATNPTLMYGYPLTEEFRGPDGLLTQYFQRARFEYHPGAEAGQRVIISPLGTALYSPGNPLDIYSPFACRRYSETGYSVCFEFLEFFDANGGAQQFGLPISSFEYHRDTIVQYFQKARFEWQPWREAGQRVVISDLGRIYFDRLGMDPGLLPPVEPLNASIKPLVLSLHVNAFVRKAVTLAEDEQTVYIVVQDQRGQPLAGTDCTLVLEWPDGKRDTAASRTDPHGTASLQFSFQSRLQGSLIPADVACRYEDLQGSTRTSFRIWY